MKGHTYILNKMTISFKLTHFLLLVSSVLRPFWYCPLLDAVAYSVRFLNIGTSIVMKYHETEFSVQLYEYRLSAK